MADLENELKVCLQLVPSCLRYLYIAYILLAIQNLILDDIPVEVDDSSEKFVVKVDVSRYPGNHQIEVQKL